MKLSSFRPTIIGLLLGIFLAGYAVFAFQSPTQAPPGGNVPAPLNVGPADQTKTGGLLQVFGLWVNQALGVSGGATFGGSLNLQGNRITNVGAPTAVGDATTKAYLDSATSGLQKKVSGSCLAGQGIRVVNADGTVLCQSSGGTLQTALAMTRPIGAVRGPFETTWSDIGIAFLIPAESKEWQCSMAAYNHVAFDLYSDPFKTRLLCDDIQVWSADIYHDTSLQFFHIGKFTTAPVSCTFQGRHPGGSGTGGAHLHYFGGACHFAK